MLLRDRPSLALLRLIAKHDDQVDALGLIGQMLATMLPGVAPIATKKIANSGYRPVEASLQMEIYNRDADSLAAYHLDAIAGEGYVSLKTL